MAVVVIALGAYAGVRTTSIGATPSERNGPAVLPAAAAPAGTPLPDGFVVPAGSQLVGDVFPIARMAYPGGLEYDSSDPSSEEAGAAPPLATLPVNGWTAVLVIDDGDVLPVFADLTGQAEALGLGLQMVAGHSACTGFTDPDSEEQPVPLELLPEGVEPVRVTCEASHRLSSSNPLTYALESATNLRVAAYAGLDALGQPTQSHLRIELTRAGNGKGTPPDGATVLHAADLPVPGPQVRVVRPALPVTGEPLAPSVGAGYLELTIPDGATAAMAASLNDCAVGWDQILTTRDGTAAFNNLMQQATEAGFVEPGNPPTQVRLADRTNLEFGAYIAGDGGDIEMWAVDWEEPANTDSILVSYCGG